MAEAGSPFLHDMRKLGDALVMGMGDEANSNSQLFRDKFRESPFSYVSPLHNPYGMTILNFCNYVNGSHVTIQLPPTAVAENPLQIVHREGEQEVVQPVEARVFIETDPYTPLRLGNINGRVIDVLGVQVDAVDETLVLATDERADMHPFGGDYDDGVYNFIDRRIRELARLNELLEIAEVF